MKILVHKRDTLKKYDEFIGLFIKFNYEIIYI